MSENGIVAPNMEHGYWGVKCKNPECQHYILREDLSLQPEGIVGIPPEPYPNFDQVCVPAGKRNDVQTVQGPEPAAAAETQLPAADRNSMNLNIPKNRPNFGEETPLSASMGHLWRSQF
jgi:hypothetical protein